MLLISNLPGSGILICISIASTAQSLPKNPKPGQVLGYHLQEQKRWMNDKLPHNSVLYKMSNPDYRVEGNKNLKQNKDVKLKYLPLPVYNTSFGDAAQKDKQNHAAWATTSKYPFLQKQDLEYKPAQTNTSELLRGYVSKKKNLLQ